MRRWKNIYLHAQIFTRVIFLTAALCSWGVRTWKINNAKNKQDARTDRAERVGMTEARIILDLGFLSRLLTIISPVKVRKLRVLRYLTVVLDLHVLRPTVSGGIM